MPKCNTGLLKERPKRQLTEPTPEDLRSAVLKIRQQRCESAYIRENSRQVHLDSLRVRSKLEETNKNLSLVLDHLNQRIISVLESFPVSFEAPAPSEAMNGQVHQSESLAQAPEASSTAAPVIKLTKRQREVLQLLAAGRQVKEVAIALKISPKTAEFHKYRLMELVGLHSTAELARFAVKIGIVH